ncbi:MAG: phosphate/phosphite/phosphonate ABC transporter substrate-binding protein [Deltaproteobacteria bacterium]|nr:MAG: phosphate/phosphite/phosphonate ABC transporter substrate-binding protein [Deltaproteobacteria bacterium]
MLVRFLVLIPMLVALLVAGCHTTEPDGPVYKIGYMNCNSETETVQRFTPLTRYLEQKVGVRFELVPVDTQDFEERFVKEKFAFAHTNSLIYLVLHEDHNARLVATEKRGQFGARTAGTIIARKGSGIRTLADIRGKRMLFGPQLAPSGFLAQYDLLLQNGIDPETDLALYGIPHGSYKHEKVIYGVYFGAWDVAAAPALDLELMIRDGRISADDFNVIAQSEIFPYCTFSAAADVDASLVARVRQALLELTPATTVDLDGEQVKVLKATWVDGYEGLSDKDYDILRQMARRANMPPYQQF